MGLRRDFLTQNWHTLHGSCCLTSASSLFWPTESHKIAENVKGPNVPQVFFWCWSVASCCGHRGTIMAAPSLTGGKQQQLERPRLCPHCQKFDWCAEKDGFFCGQSFFLLISLFFLWFWFWFSHPKIFQTVEKLKKI